MSWRRHALNSTSLAGVDALPGPGSDSPPPDAKPHRVPGLVRAAPPTSTDRLNLATAHDSTKSSARSDRTHR